MLSKHTKLTKKSYYIKNAQDNPEQVQFSTLDYCCLGIMIIDKLKPSFTFVSRLYLDHNELITLNGIQQFQNLELLSFNFNRIAGFQNLLKIPNKFFMKGISMIGNPLEADSNCSYEILSQQYFTNLTYLNKVRSISKSPTKHYLPSITKKKPQITQHHIHDNFNYIKLQTLPEQGKTQRYAGSYNVDTHKTYSKRSINNQILRNQEYQPQQQIDNGMNTKRFRRQKSTAANQELNMSSKQTRIAPGYIYQIDKNKTNTVYHVNHNKSLNDNIFIRPFTEQTEKEHSFAHQKQYIYNQKPDFDVLNNKQFQFLQSQGDPSFDNSKIFQITRGWKIERPIKSSAKSHTEYICNKIQQPSDIYTTGTKKFSKNIMFQFLQNQKQQVSLAFYHRTLKQKSFGLLFSNLARNSFSNNQQQWQQQEQLIHSQQQQQQQNKKLIKKTFAALKLYQHLGKLYEDN